MNLDIASPELNEALTRWAGRANEEGRKDAALLLAREALKYSETIQGLLQLATIYDTREEFDQAITTINRLIAAFPHDVPSAAYQVLGVTQAHAGRLDQAIRALQACLAMEPQSTIVGYLLASCFACNGQFDEANKALQIESRIMCGDGKFTSSNIIRLPAGRTVSSMDTPALPFLRNVTTYSDYVTRDFDVVYFVCCDSRYFELFAEPLANSIERNSGLRCLLHLHIINPDDRVIAALQAARERPNLAIATSAEHTDLNVLSEDKRRTYYTCARFLMLPDLQKKYGLPMIVADIDQLVVKTLSTFLRTACAHDVSLIHFARQSCNLLSLVSASLMVTSVSEQASLFSRGLRNYLAERMRDTNNMSWHLDQAALAVSFLAMPSVRYNLLAPEIIGATSDARSAEATSPSLFWTITYSNPQNAAKLESNGFRSYVET